MHTTTYNWRMYCNKHPKRTYYRAPSTRYSPLVNCVMTIALQFSLNTNAPTTTNKTNLHPQPFHRIIRTVHPQQQQSNHPPGQCHIAHNKPRRTYQIPSSMRLLPNPSNMDTGSAKGPFQNLAQSHRRGNQTILTKIRGNHHGTFRPTKEEHTIHKITQG